MTGNPKYADTGALRADLWQDCLYRFLPNRPTSDAERHHAALDRLADLLRAAVRAPENSSARQEIVDDAAVLLQLLVAEVGAPLLELNRTSNATGVSDAETADRIAKPPLDDPVAPRKLLLDLILQQRDACPPLHRRCLEPAVAILPRSLLAVCFDALAARDMGEMHPFLSAEPTRRARPWSFDLARLRALEHVEFLAKESRLLKKEAIFEVCRVLGIKENTLRGWRTELRSAVCDLDARLKIARKAGVLAHELKNKPDFASRPRTTVDPHVVYLFLQLRDEPLAIFGARYRHEFGSVKRKQ
jgi:hypothetical protein